MVDDDDDGERSRVFFPMIAYFLVLTDIFLITAEGADISLGNQDSDQEDDEDDDQPQNEDDDDDDDEDQEEDDDEDGDGE